MGARLVDPSVDSSVVLYVHVNAPTNKVMAGHWLNEKMPLERLVDFYELNDARNACWRQVLSNDWTAWFGVKEVEASSLQLPLVSSIKRDFVGRRVGRSYGNSLARVMYFISVTHYLLYKEFPELRVNNGTGSYFSVFEKDSGEPSCYTVRAARAYAALARRRARGDGEGGGDSQLVSEAHGDEVHAIISKFIAPENVDLKYALLATKNAEIKCFRPGEETVPFYALMEARNRIRDAKGTVACTM